MQGTNDELLMEQLRKTLAAERTILAGLPMLAADADAPAGRLDIEMQRTAERIRRLEQIADVAGQHSGGGGTAIEAIIADLGELFSNAGRAEIRKAATVSALEAVRQILIARYTALSVWAMLVGKEEVAKALFSTLDDERMLPAQIAGAPIRRDKMQSEISLGERLTAMFDRRK